MPSAFWSRLSASLFVLSVSTSTFPQATSAASGQPVVSNAPIGQFQEVGNSIASAQQVSFDFARPPS